MQPDDLEKRKRAMLAIIGMWADRNDLPDTETYIRELRSGKRREYLESIRSGEDAGEPGPRT